ncbi:MAG TPA: tryptophan--tRNA ligase [Thermoanaerobaculia bacterium]|nr:tryptophan--tRNA ligase [Thermoanaerobaculia bacterium]
MPTEQPSQQPAETSATSGEKKIVLSGMRSTGRIHLGNYFGAIKNWVDLQDDYRCFYFAADWHALTTDYADPSKVADNTLEAVADWIAAGLDPERSTIFIQSLVPEHAELHLLLSMITPVGWLERVPTYKDQQQQIEGKDLATYGFLGYPALQTADVALYRAHYVPVGQDQASHLELSREIVRRFTHFYGEVFPEPKPLFTPSPKVPGIDGRKMSKSYGNAINLADPPEVIRQKCMAMFTDPQRQRRSDPGRPEVCNLFEFHKLVSPTALQEDVARQCRAAEIGCVQDKKLIAEQLIELLEPMRERREELVRDKPALLDMLVEGSRRAREQARETMERVRSAMSLDYRKAVEVARSAASDAAPGGAATEPAPAAPAGRLR